MAKATLPEPQDRAGFVVSGGNDGDTYSLLDEGADGPRPLIPAQETHPDISGVTIRTGRLNRAHLDEWLNGDCPSLSAHGAMAHLEPEYQTRQRSLRSSRWG